MTCSCLLVVMVGPLIFLYCMNDLPASITLLLLSHPDRCQLDHSTDKVASHIQYDNYLNHLEFGVDKWKISLSSS